MLRYAAVIPAGSGLPTGITAERQYRGPDCRGLSDSGVAQQCVHQHGDLLASTFGDIQASKWSAWLLVSPGYPRGLFATGIREGSKFI